MRLKFWLSLGVVLLSGCGGGDETKLVADPDQGRQLYSKNCAGCHGLMMNGTDQGPPLNHKVYEPGHHGDSAFYRAVKEGTRAHHWKFGDMPPQPQVSPADVAHIIAYVRARQQKSGIH